MNGFDSVDPSGDQTGWVCADERYGIWFVSRDAVKASIRKPLVEKVGIEDREPSDDEVVYWFREHFTWSDIVARGVQLQRADMSVFEKRFLEAAKSDNSAPERTREIIPGFGTW